MNFAMPALHVVLNYVHLLCIFVLLGVLFFVRFVSTPLMRRLAPTDTHAVPLLVRASDKVILFAWIAYGVVAVNGTLLMLVSPNYKGFMVVASDDPWSVAMLAKHAAYALLGAGLLAYGLVVKANRRRLAANLPDHAGSMDGLALLNVLLGLAVVAFAAVTRYGYAWSLLAPYVVHTFTLACWIGGLFFVLFIGTPTVSGMVQARELPPLDGIHHLQMVANRFIKVLWFSMFASIFTGFAMLFLDTTVYGGFLHQFEGPRLLMTIKQAAFLVTILGAFVVTPAIARLGVRLQAAAAAQPVGKETMAVLLHERSIILNGAKYGFGWLQIVLLITAILMVVRG